MLPITLTGLAAITMACIYLMQTGLRRGILNPYLLICLSYVRFFGFPLEDQDYAFIVDLATLLAFACFSIAFFHAKRGSDRRMRTFLIGVWPCYDRGRIMVPPLTRVATVVLAAAIVAYCLMDLWLASLAYGGLQRAMVRFYVSEPLRDASPWFTRIPLILYWMPIVLLFVLRLNCTIYRRGHSLVWLALLVSLAVAFPAGSAGRFLSPIVTCVFADVLAALLLKKSLRPRFDMVVLGGLAVCGAMLLLTIRNMQFGDIGQIAQLVDQQKHSVASRAVERTEHAHAMVLGDAAFCLRTFGKSEPFLPGHTLYTILVNPIPREMWPSKPIGFGRILGQIQQGEYGSSHAKPRGWSIAAGLAGEGYANAGYCGVVFLSLAVGYLCGKAAKCATIGFAMPSYPLLMVSLALYRLSTFFVRGDVHSAWTTSVYPVFLLILVFAFFARASSFLKTACRGVPRGTHRAEGAAL